MNVEDAKKSQLLEAIVEVEGVKAATFVDEQGVRSKIEGEAWVFETKQAGDPPGDGEEESHEDVYLEAIGAEYLVVVFPARGEVESIKREVARLRSRLDL